MGKIRDHRYTDEELCELFEEAEELGYITLWDGCPVEIDGRCPHGHQSPLVTTGLV